MYYLPMAIEAVMRKLSLFPLEIFSSKIEKLIKKRIVADSWQAKRKSSLYKKVRLKNPTNQCALFISDIS